MLLDGIHVPLTAPFYSDGAGYWRKLEHNVRRYCLSPIAGLIALPPGEETDALTDAEGQKTLRIVADSASKEKVLLAGIMRGSVDASVHLANQAAEAGFDVVLLGAPSQWPRLRGGDAGTGELAAFLQAVADASPLPVALWSEARAPGLQLPTTLVALLARHPNLLSLYEVDLTVDRLQALQSATAAVEREVAVTPVFAPVTGRMLKGSHDGPATFVGAAQLGSGGVSVAVAPPQPVLRTRTKRVGFQIMGVGRVNRLADLLTAGAAGMAPTLAACAPQACHEVLAAFQDGNPGLAVEKTERLLAADDLLAELGPAGLKYGCDLHGFYGGRVRLPRLPLTASERLRVEAALRSVRS